MVLFFNFSKEIIYDTRNIRVTRWTKNRLSSNSVFWTGQASNPRDLPTYADAGWPVDRSISFSLRQERLGYSAKPELLPLVRLSRDLPPFRARALLEAGYPTPVKLAGADCTRIAEVFMRCLPFRSAGWDASEVSLLDNVRRALNLCRLLVQLIENNHPL